jgi:hypothetical protein
MSAAGWDWQACELCCRPLLTAPLPLPLMYCSPADVERLTQLAQDPRPMEAKQVRPGSRAPCLAGLCSRRMPSVLSSRSLIWELPVSWAAAEACGHTG